MRGRTIRLSKPRRLVCDLLHFARQVPSVPVQRRMALAPVVAARSRAAPRPGWCAIFTRAYALVAAETPELRRAYLKFPTPRLYEHPASVAAVAVERRQGGEYAVMMGLVKGPAGRSLGDLDAQLRRGAESLHPLTPLTTALNYGVIGPDGRVDVRLVYDHRVLDGATVARALARLEEVLNGTIAAELRGLAADRVA
jgi:hypothetical protein